MSAFAATNLEKFIDFPSHAASSSRSRNTFTSDPCVLVICIFCRIAWCADRRGFLWLWFSSYCWFLFTNFTTGLEESLKKLILFTLSLKFRITRESSLLCTKVIPTQALMPTAAQKETQIFIRYELSQKNVCVEISVYPHIFLLDEKLHSSLSLSTLFFFLQKKKKQKKVSFHPGTGV